VTRPGAAAVVIGEALIDLIGDREEGCYRAVPGGSPLNVAVGVARLGSDVEFIGSFGNDHFGLDLQSFLRGEGVGLAGSVVAECSSSLAVTSLEASEPSYTFYGTPASYGQLRPEAVPESMLESAAVIHAGSISLLEEPVYRLVTEAFATQRPVRTLDPNIRPSLIPEPSRFRDSLELLFRNVDLVKMSIEDATALYGAPVDQVLERVSGLGPGLVVVTVGGDGVCAWFQGEVLVVPGRTIEATDTTGAGDAFMAAIIAEIVRAGLPQNLDDCRAILRFAVDVSALTCLSPGGASAIPTRAEVDTAFPA
jgi:sugar/nucleoside kinase (ribokinase family)